VAVAQGGAKRGLPPKMEVADALGGGVRCLVLNRNVQLHLLLDRTVARVEASMHPIQ
jgi:hypothetical protein